MYKIHLLASGEITFALTSGGHNMGIVSPPGTPKRGYRVLTHSHQGKYIDADTYLAQAARHEGSWWTAWFAWLDAHSTGAEAPPRMGAPTKGYPPIEPAPGSYVMQS